MVGMHEFFGCRGTALARRNLLELCRNSRFAVLKTWREEVMDIVVSRPGPEIRIKEKIVQLLTRLIQKCLYLKVSARTFLSLLFSKRHLSASYRTKHGSRRHLCFYGSLSSTQRVPTIYHPSLIALFDFPLHINSHVKRTSTANAHTSD